MSENSLGIKRIHHVELWVGNAKQAAYYYQHAFGFTIAGYRGLETNSRGVASYALRQNGINLILSTPLVAEGPMAENVKLHGDGVHDITFEVEDVEHAFVTAIKGGALPVGKPIEHHDEERSIMHAAVKTYGETLHSFIQKPEGADYFLPGFATVESQVDDAGLLVIDHIVGNVELGKMSYWADWYTKVMGFERYITFDDKDISTEFSALQSVVMADPQRVIKFPINEPAEGRKISQIQEYLDFYRGPGVQHIALLTNDIIGTVRVLRRNGVDFLDAPATYYDKLSERVGKIDEDINALAELGILVDADDDGYLLQIFTNPVQDRPTMFYEIIQRKGSRGFGKGNFRALFESIEQEQARRGNL